MPHDMHPAGTFEAAVADHGYSTSSRGTDQLFVKFDTEHGSITGFFALTDRAIDYTLEKVRAMGYAGDDLGELADGRALVGKRCQITVDHEEYQGKIRPKVGFVNPPGSSGPGVQRDGRAAANAKRFNALLRKKPVVTSEPPSQGPDDDDTPF